MSKASMFLLLTPEGQLHVGPQSDDMNTNAQIHQTSILDAFNHSQEQGLLQLLIENVDSHWSLTLKYWRNFMTLYMNELCHHATSDVQNLTAISPPGIAVLQTWILNFPPMPGAEYASTDVLHSIWSAFDAWCRQQIAANNDGLAGFLTTHLPTWHQVGRVCFHLAENKQDTDYPFAFMATYAVHLSHTLQYQPLRHALQEYAGLDNKAALYHLLKPVHDAALHCAWVREAIDTHDIYHPLAWTITEGYQFLQSIPQLEAAGLTVKCPNWWKKRSKAKVQVNIGGKKNTLLSAQALLDFKVTVAIDGEPLTPEELERIYQAETGLMVLRGQYVEVDAAKLKQALSHWEHLQAQAADGLSFIEGMRLLAGLNRDLKETNVSDDIHTWSSVVATQELGTLLEKIRHPENIQIKHPGDALKATLRPYQASGVAWLDLLTELGLGACLADDMGLGKTIQIISLLLLKKQKQPNKPSVLVLPASLLANWKSEIKRFAPTLQALFLHPSECNINDLQLLATDAAQTFKSWDLVVITYGMLQRQSWLTKLDWHLIILDEAQAIKNPTSIQTKLAKTLQGDARVALTGTPIENRLGDLWSLYDFICPGLLGTSAGFKQFIKSMQQHEQASYAPLRQLVQPYLLRRLKTDKSIISDLPDKIEVNTWCALTHEQLKLYTQTIAEMTRALESTEISIQRKGLVLAYLTRFKQICNHPGQLLGDNDYDARRSGKFERLAYLFEEILTRQEKVLIFTQYRAMTTPIAAFLKRQFGATGLVLHGGTPVGKRQGLVDSFQQTQGSAFFVLSLKAGGTGLNLTAANHVIHFDRWWNPAVENQATDRAYRIGQDRKVLVHKMISKGTIEEKIDQLISEKVSLASDILQVNGETLLTEMDNQQLLDLVRLDMNQMMRD